MNYNCPGLRCPTQEAPPVALSPGSMACWSGDALLGSFSKIQPGFQRLSTKSVNVSLIIFMLTTRGNDDILDILGKIYLKNQAHLFLFTF